MHTWIRHSAKKTWCADPLLALALWLFLPLPGLAQEGPAQEIFLPKTEKSPVVVATSGQSGPPNYRSHAKQVAELGYYTVLIDDREILTRQQDGAQNLRTVITKAQQIPLDLVVCPKASHGCNLDGRTYRADDTADAWRRTVAMLTRHHPLK